jgi:hypothetical protein
MRAQGSRPQRRFRGGPSEAVPEHAGHTVTGPASLLFIAPPFDLFFSGSAVVNFDP